MRMDALTLDALTRDAAQPHTSTPLRTLILSQLSSPSASEQRLTVQCNDSMGYASPLGVLTASTLHQTSLGGAQRPALAAVALVAYSTSEPLMPKKRSAEGTLTVT